MSKWSSWKKSKKGKSSDGNANVENITRDVADSVDSNNPVLPYVFAAAGMVAKEIGKDCAKATSKLIKDVWSDN